jgi:uncharacterized membrane protein YesL
MNRKLKGTILLLPLISLVLYVLITEPEFLLIIGLILIGAVILFISIEGLNLITDDNKEVK